MSDLKKKKFFAVLIILVLLAILIRSLVLNAPLSHDEWYTYDLVARNFTDMNNQMYDDVHVPLYFYIAKAFTYLFGLSELKLKILSVIFGVLGIAAFAIFTKNFFGDRVSIVSTALVSISVFHVAYSQTARMYSLFFLAIVLSLYFLFELIFEWKNRSIIGYVLSNIIVLYTHFFGAFFLLFELVSLYRFKDKLKDKKRVIWGHIILATALIPFCLFMLLQVFRKVNGTSYANWMQPTTVVDAYIAISALSSNHILTPLFIAIIILFLWKKTISKKNAELTEQKESILAFGILICLVLPSIITFITPIFAWRYFFIAYPMFLIIISIYLVTLLNKKKPLLNLLVGCVFFLLILSSLVYLEKNTQDVQNRNKCINLIKSRIALYEQKDTAFVTYRWLNEWVPNHKPTIGAKKRLEEIFEKEMVLINYHNTSLDYLYENHTYIMAISQSGWEEMFINLNDSVVIEKGECSRYSKEKVFSYVYYYFVYTKNKTLSEEEIIPLTFPKIKNESY